MTEPLPGLTRSEEDSAPLGIIRTETALSRFPIHRLVKKGDVQIEIKNQAAALLWEVTYNTKYGQPGPLAYKLDTLIVNRRIEEVGRPVPSLIRLGSLRDICREMGNSEGGESTLAIRKALLQNASAFIDAKLLYRATDKSERFLEAAFTRYSVIFTGETLPDGKTADAVFLILNQPYVEVLNAAILRPLDYEYMKSLPPAAQRFYEIVSYQIYAALHFQNERAKLRYSEYCLLSTATRYFDFDHVKKQMYKIHKSHLDSGYLAKVTYEATTDSQGQPDWFMYYVPGPNAAREYQAFTGTVQRGGKGKKPAAKAAPVKDPLLLPFPEYHPGSGQGTEGGTAAAPIAPPLQMPQETPLTPETSETAVLIESLVAADLNQADAERFASTKPAEARRQLLYLPYKTDLENPGGYLRRAIEGGFPAPKEYKAAQAKQEWERKKQEETERKSAQEAAQKAAEALEAAEADKSIARLEIEAPEAFAAFSAYVDKERQSMLARYASMKAPIRARMMQMFDTPTKRRELFVLWQAMPKGADIPPGSDPIKEEKPETAQDAGGNDPAAVAALVRASLAPAERGAKD